MGNPGIDSTERSKVRKVMEGTTIITVLLLVFFFGTQLKPLWEAFSKNPAPKTPVVLNDVACAMVLSRYDEAPKEPFVGCFQLWDLKVTVSIKPPYVAYIEIVHKPLIEESDPHAERAQLRDTNAADRFSRALPTLIAAFEKHRENRREFRKRDSRGPTDPGKQVEHERERKYEENVRHALSFVAQVLLDYQGTITCKTEMDPHHSASPGQREIRCLITSTFDLDRAPPPFLITRDQEWWPIVWKNGMWIRDAKEFRGHRSTD